MTAFVTARRLIFVSVNTLWIASDKLPFGANVFGMLLSLSGRGSGSHTEPLNWPTP